MKRQKKQKLTRRLTLSDVDKLIAEAFPTAEMGGIKLIRCLEARYVCRYHSAEIVPAHFPPFCRHAERVCVRFESVNMFRENKITTSAMWELQEIEEAGFLSLIRERAIFAIIALKGAHEESDKEAATDAHDKKFVGPYKEG